jgi:hypothetical protein
MAKKQGKVKMVPAKEIREGMQFIDTNRGGLIVKITSTDGGIMVDNHWRVAGGWLMMLVVEYTEYEQVYPKSGRDFQGHEKYDDVTYQIPLKYSQWQSAIDNGELNSDKMVEFEIVKRAYNKDGFPITNAVYEDDYVKSYAKIIPIEKKERLYTEEQLIEAMKYASSHLSSLNGILKYVESIKIK